jgi:hypothetical protein
VSVLSAAAHLPAIRLSVAASWGLDPTSISAAATVLAAVGTVGTLGFVLWNQRKDADTARAVQLSAQAAQVSAAAAQATAEAAQEEAAGAWRPVLTVEEGTLTHRFGTDHPDGDVEVQMQVKNVGRGPALRVRVTLEPNVTYGDPRLSNANREAQSPDQDWYGLMPIGEPTTLRTRRHAGEPAATYVMRAFYLDLGGREYQTYVSATVEPQLSTDDWMQYELTPTVVMVPRAGDEAAERLAQLDAP